MGYFKGIAILGNILYFLWVLYNGISEGAVASTSPVRILSYIGVLLLFLLNTLLLYRKK